MHVCVFCVVNVVNAKLFCVVSVCNELWSYVYGLLFARKYVELNRWVLSVSVLQYMYVLKLRNNPTWFFGRVS